MFEQARTALFAAVVLIALGLAPAFGSPVKLPAGMQVNLELQHHVNSGYVPAGSPIFFRVANDVVIDGSTLIRKGTLVEGKMQQATARGRVGKSGSMTLDVRAVRAVDGSTVAISADVSKQGRSRAGATVAWALVWGIPGLLTQGVNPYMERGTAVAASVTAEASIDPANASPAEAPAPSVDVAAKITAFRYGTAKIDEVKFDIERDKDLKNFAFDVSLPDVSQHITAMSLVSVDGVAVPIETRPVTLVGSTARSTS